ncbi:hypothetical protein D8674_026318 [Pyrus ussuriensis x Pyrus communis]|uniref:Reverse transcriptase domain-containing protein n=1 Tax=Pyrus ussuriensis x Pyrus communis TaxID=2448454 RepID=A0A5N5IL11_9ROSA|nr:hypothetical protein D8674_026318 [Pyrus ussuriensis x Pyrus communis]
MLEKDTSKEIWDSMKTKCEGNARVKRLTLQALRRDFETLEIKLMEKQHELIHNVSGVLSSKAENASNFVDAESIFGLDTSLVYKHFATLYLVIVSDNSENELAMLNLIQEDIGSFLLCYTMNIGKEERDCLNITFEDSLDLEERFDNTIHLVGRLIASHEPFQIVVREVFRPVWNKMGVNQAHCIPRNYCMVKNAKYLGARMGAVLERAKNRKFENDIKGFFGGAGTWLTIDLGIEKTVLNYFEDTFRVGPSGGGVDVLQSIESRVTPEMNLQLNMSVSGDEVRVALFQMHPSKALGQDGMSLFFIQRFWSIVGVDVIVAIQSLFYSVRVLKQINYTHIALIPKVKAPKDVAQFRPISFCNVLSKIASKVMANRLKFILTRITSLAQSAFVLGRLISDNSLLASMISNFLSKKRRGKKRFLSLKLDISKAYDIIESHYLRSIQTRLGSR